MKIYRLLATFIGLLLLLVWPVNAMAGAACVIAKVQGNSEAIEWGYSSGSAEEVLSQVKQSLRKRGYEKLFPQAVTELGHAYVIVIKSHYKNSRGKDRVSYGCGFSEKSYDEALWAAIRNLQSYAWGWKPDREGYQISDKARY